MTTTAEISRIESGHPWYGYLTLGNFSAAAERIRVLLDGRRYTFVSYNTAMPHTVPEVRTGQRLRDPIKVTRSPLDDGREMAHLSAHDTYGVWGLSSTVPDQETAQRLADSVQTARQLTYLHFRHGHYDGGLVEIAQRNAYGDRLVWVIAAEADGDGGTPPELGGLLAAKRLETQPVWDAAAQQRHAGLLAFTVELAAMSTDAERQDGMEGEPDPEVREGDTEILDNLITRARKITGGE